MAGQSATITISGMNDANNCPGDLSSSGTVLVNVIQSPTADADPTVNSCAGIPVVLNGSIGGTGIGMWSSPGDGTFSDASQGNSNYTPGPNDIMNGSVILEWLVTDPLALCAQLTAMTTVTISEAVEITLDPSQMICSNQEVALDPFVTISGLDISWTTNGDGFFSDPFLSSTTYLPGTNDILFENVELTITISDPAGLCPDIVAAQAITIQSRMMVDLPDSIFICPDENVFLTPLITGEYVSVMWMTDGDGTFDDGTSEMTTYEPGPGDLGDRFIELIILVTDQSPVCEDTIGAVTLVIETCSCPSVEVFQPTQPICNSEGSMVNLNSLEVTPEEGSWTVLSAPPGPTPGTISGDVFNAGNASAGLYELTFHLDNPVAGCPDSSLIQIDVIAAPQAIIVGDDAYCNPDTIDFLANVEGQAEVFQWQSNGNGSFNAADMISSMYTPDAQDLMNGGFQLIVLAQDSGGICPDGTDTMQISLFQPPFATLSNTVLAICNDVTMGSVINLSALVTGGDTGGSWSVASGQAIDLSAPNAVNFDGITPGNVMLEYRTNSAMPPCIDSVYQVLVQVQDCSCPPIVVGAIPAGICAQDSIIGLNDFIAGSDPGIWSITMIEGTGMIPTISMDSLVFTRNSHGTFELMYTLQAAPIPDCPDSANFELFIQQRPTVNLPHDTLVCASSTIDLTASIGGTATGGNWSSLGGDGSFQSTNQTSTIYTPGSGDIGAGIVTVLFTSIDTFGFCPSDMVMMNVSFADTAFATFLLNQTVTCNQVDSGSVVNLSAFISGGDSSGNWMDIDGSGVDLSNPASVDFDGVTPGSYTFSYQTVSAVAPCLNPTYAFEVIVENCACPSVALSLPDTSVCNQAMGIDLDHFVLTTEPGTWSIVAQPPGMQPGFIQNNEFVIMDADSGMYVLKYTLNDSIPGCPASNTMAFQVDLPPTIEIIDIGCSDDNQFYEVGLTSTGEEPELNFGVLVVISPQVYRITDIPLDETLVIKFRQPGTACKSSAIISPPQCDCILDIDFYTSRVSCFGATDGQIIIDSLSGISAEPCIRVNGGDCMPLDNIPFIIPDLGPGTYQLQLEDDAGCMKSKQAVITEPAELIVDLGGDRSVMAGDSIIIDPVLNFNPVIWTYNPAIFDSTIISGTYNPTGDLMLTLLAYDVNDCFTSDQIFIDVLTGPANEEIIFIPNVFTPNTDNRNDKLYVQATSGIEMIESFRIFDRWGHLVYEISQFPPNESSIGWDGSRNGDSMLSGVYVYQLIYQSGQNQVVRTGDVTLLK
jgi:gliding motility-associated-like protein